MSSEKRKIIVRCFSCREINKVDRQAKHDSVLTLAVVDGGVVGSVDLGVVLRGELAEAEEVDHFQAESVPDRLEIAIACKKMVENATAER